MKKNFILYVSLIILLLGCSKEFNQNYPKKQILINRTYSYTFDSGTGFIDPSNVANPYDSIGIFHNLAIEELSTVDFIESENIQEAYILTISDLLENNGISSDSFINLFDSICSEMQIVEQYISQDTSNSAYFQFLYSQGKTTQLQRDYLYNLDDIITSIGQVFQAQNGNIVNTCNEIINEIIDLENIVLEDDDLIPNNQSVLILSCCAIAKYSCVHHADILLNNQNPFRNLGTPLYLPDDNGMINDPNYQKYISADWKKIINADIAGAAGGAVSSLIGALSGPVAWGVVVGTIIGAGAGNSMKELVRQILNGAVTIFSN